MQTTPCFSCLCRNNSRGNQTQHGEEEDPQQHEEEDEVEPRQYEDEEEHLEDSRIIHKKVVLEDGKRQSHKTNCSFRSKHPKSDIVVNRLEKSKEDQNTTETVPQISNVEMSLFPIQLSVATEDFNLEDLQPFDKEMAEAEHISNSIENVSNSIQICSICLEEYKVGEDIGWSRNSECHHAFHKDCIIEWLKSNDDCPICRKRY